MTRKGFPESYDGTALIRFLSDVKAGKRNVLAPVYSHLVYDVVPGETITVEVSSGPQLVNVPDVTGLSLAQATQELQQAGFKVQVQGPPYHGTVWGYSPVTPQASGSTITLNLNSAFPFP